MTVVEVVNPVNVAAPDARVASDEASAEEGKQGLPPPTRPRGNRGGRALAAGGCAAQTVVRDGKGWRVLNLLPRFGTRFGNFLGPGQ